MIFEALNNFIYVIRDETEKEKSGLLIPGKGQVKPAMGTAYSIGSLTRDAKLKKKVGKKLLFFSGTGFEQEIEGTTYLVLTDDQVHGGEK